MASTYLTRTFGAETNRKIWTWSAWVKRQNLVSDHQNALFAVYENTSNRSVFRFNAHQLNFQDTGNSVEIKTNRLFRDTSAWYHIVARVDTTQATASDRVRIYVNGEQETSFATATYPNQNANMMFNNSFIHFINARQDGSIDSIADMSYSHIHFTDGYSYAPTEFGEYDANGVWKIKTSPSVTYGNNGFFILKDGNSVTDQSGNSNNFTVAGGTLTKTEDSPSNVFATWNPLEPELSYKGTYSNGNTTVTTTTTGGTSLRGSIAIPYTGKWYWENKVVSTSGTIADNSRIGIATGDSVTVGSNVRYMSNGQKTVDASASSYGATYGAGDIIGVAVDSDNNTVEFFKNGVSQGSISYTMDSSLTYKPYISENSNSISITFSANFGNGYFGTTAVASAGTNASGIGIFEHDVPNGYTSLSTKGLNL
ncbi:hypothetical protein HTVC024P_gp40 [Pelagibacter phage HTVC024P]|nr:hypothetical protein HTVC024P_gp40 [Pelagibacter phage HTVC024P]